MLMYYKRIGKGFGSYSLFPENVNIEDIIQTHGQDKDYYQSIFKYNDSHYKKFFESLEQSCKYLNIPFKKDNALNITGKVLRTLKQKAESGDTKADELRKSLSVSGTSDIHTSKLVFDFDSENNINQAKTDTLSLYNKLLSKGLKKENIQICFSGNKGFSVEVVTKQMFNQEKFMNIVFSLANEYSTFDRKIKDPQRLFRLPLTMHQKTGLYKIPIDPEVLPDLDPLDLKKQAKSITDRHWDIFDSWKKVETLPKEIENLKFVEKVEVETNKLTDTESLYLDLSKKPNWLSEARYVLQEGYFKKGNRNEAMMILASTYKLNGFDRDQAAALLDVVADKQAAINNETRKSSQEIDREILDVVYSSLWKGGVYSEETNPLLQEIIKKYSLRRFKDDSVNPKFIDGISNKFKDFVKNLDKNTIKTGIKSLDQNLFLTTGTNVGLLGAPGSGKTSLALNILNNTSKQGIKSIFVSLDMSSTRLFEKVCYKVTGLNRDQLYKKFENDQDDEIIQKINKEFGNVYFMDKTATTVEDIEKYIDQCEQDCGEKIKLVLIDYFERVNCDEGSDDFAASKKVASKIQDLVNSRNICAITLLQPNKFSGDLSTPILSYNNIKGTSFLAQSFRVILSIYREGFSPEGSDNDNFLTLNILKNDLGETKKLDFSWNGRKGEIAELDHLGKQELEQLRNKINKNNEDFEF